MQESAPVSVSAPAQPAPALEPEAQRLTGTLVRVRSDEGYGFIRPDNGPPDYFVAISSFRHRRDFRVDQRVEFTPGVARRSSPHDRPKAPPAWDVVALPALPGNGGLD
ncbi:MAG TPA: hypothetical protein VGG42_18870 [Acidobacteriaceae bacterium]|jgi:cold shock CspA family protein